MAWVFTSKDNFEKYPYKLPELKDNEIRMRVLSAGLCQSDSHFGRGLWGKKEYPVATGHETIGKIVAMGKDVKDFKVGDIVAHGPFRDSCAKCRFCLKG